MADESETPTDDDMRKRFQDALERKKNASHATATGAGGAGDKGHGGSGPAKAQRTFRRKSG